MLPHILSADDLAISLGFYRKLSILAADDFLGACYRKAMTPKKLWTLLFPQSWQIMENHAPENAIDFRLKVPDVLCEWLISHASA